MEFLIALILLICLIIFTCEGAGVLLDKSEPFFISLSDNIYLILGVIFFCLSILAYLYLKPHEAERYFDKYKNGEISRDVAIRNIANTMYNARREKLPSIYQNKIMVIRLQFLRKRIREESAFLVDLQEYIKNRERA